MGKKVSQGARGSAYIGEGWEVRKVIKEGWRKVKRGKGADVTHRSMGRSSVIAW